MKVKDIEKKYNIKLNVSPDMNIEDFLRKEGLPNLAKLLKTQKK